MAKNGDSLSTLIKRKREVILNLNLSIFLLFVLAQRAIDALNNTPINGYPLRVSYYNDNRKWNLNVFVKNIDKRVTQKELYDVFSKYGKINSCKVGYLGKLML